MGMAASQARFLSLTARKTNTEWEGQQVNQQRTALANESANLFNQLQAIPVPTPPSTSDYYTTVYTFKTNELDNTSKAGATEYTVENIYSTPQGNYAKLSFMQYSWQPYASTSYSGIISKGVDEQGNENYKVNLKDGSEYEAKKLTYQPTGAEMQFTMPESGVISFGNSDIQFKLDDTGSVITGSKDGQNYTYEVTKVSDNTYKINLKAQKPDDTSNNYRVTIGDCTANLTLNSDGTYTVESISGIDSSNVIGGYFDSKGSQSASVSYIDPSFFTVKTSDVDPSTGKQKVLQNQPILAYSINGNALYISATETSNAGYFSSSTQVLNQGSKAYVDMPCTYTVADTGRYSSLTVTDEYGHEHTFSLEVENVQDEAAYKQAMLDYEYEQTKYQKKIADINAKTEKIQQEDRTLELRLKQLDTEQKALATEMDAIKDVIKDNVEKTFKTFA